MSRTRLTVLTALGLLLVAVAIGVARWQTGGTRATAPPGQSSWEVTLTATGQLPDDKHGGLVVSTPPDFRHQHIFDETMKSNELVHREGRGVAARGHPTQDVPWKRRPGGAADKGYKLTYTFRCVLGIRRPFTGMKQRTLELDATPDADGTRQSTARIESDSRQVADLARELTGDTTAVADQIRAFYDHVVAMGFEGSDGTATALDCLKAGAGDAAARSRLLVALCRNRGIPARVITGIVLNPDSPPAFHHWAEAWVRAADSPGGRWVPADVTYEHFGTHDWPENYLVVRLDDEPIIRGPGRPTVGVMARPLSDTPPADESRILAFWRVVSFGGLPPSEQQLIRFLLLLPVAGVIISFLRVVVGVPTYGIFSPALLGLIFRNTKALPWGLGIFVATVLVGWLLRRVLDRFNLLLIPRTAILLTMIVAFLMTVLIVASRAGMGVTHYLALFPLVILTHMVERFWTVEAEDGTRASFRTLLGTVVVATIVALAVSPDAVGWWLFTFPETLAAIVAVCLLLGRYTGYRVTELYRFQDIIEFQNEAPPAVTSPEPPPSPAVAPPASGEGQP
ncbi:7TM domain-containing protein [Fimbriiglobus ruber]|uniref:Transglutaminase-like domain-containing protein n=1 Tax=Fimbriiglobus ruber TaxID=1908690 RepID=A0A225DGG4_9BACT|nr:7TM domain-containing protein [Fimbriiglobus ruber]OWK36446.1 hypothetical protein FRUB_09009 [Fimbriiglobus ruber]